MDIVAALHWVKDNIAAFGGDPTRITIVGHDTGAALANLILISKSGKGKYIGLTPHFFAGPPISLLTHAFTQRGQL